MTATELKAFRSTLGLSQAEFAEVFGVASDRTVRRWEGGERDIPRFVEILAGLIKSEPTVRERLGLRRSS